MTGEALALRITNNPEGYSEHEVLLAQTVHTYTFRVMRWSKWGQDVQAERDAARAEVVSLKCALAAKENECYAIASDDIEALREQHQRELQSTRAEVAELRRLLDAMSQAKTPASAEALVAAETEAAVARAEVARLRELVQRIGENLMHEEDCTIFERRKKDQRCNCWLVDVLPLLDAALAAEEA